MLRVESLRRVEDTRIQFQRNDLQRIIRRFGTAQGGGGVDAEAEPDLQQTDGTVGEPLREAGRLHELPLRLGDRSGERMEVLAVPGVVEGERTVGSPDAGENLPFAAAPETVEEEFQELPLAHPPVRR